MDVRQIRVDRSSENEDENNTFDYINLIEKNKWNRVLHNFIRSVDKIIFVRHFEK